VSEMATINAAARAILKLCEDDGDERMKLERISYASAVIRWHAEEALKSLDPSTEANHV